MRVALTIDTEMRGHPARDDNPQRQLDSLADAQARATFFVQGRWATAHPELTRRIVADGHLLANHSHWHMPLDLLTDDGIRETVKRAETALMELTGIDPRPWFRCPYGAGEDDQRVVHVLAGLGYENARWEVDPRDWLAGQTADDVVKTVVAGAVAAGDGARILLHSWPDVTADVLPRLVAELRAAGAELVRLDELIS
jgi:peptidoglycan/xylan/chitin deacetylase (PgdA/CDA1 family)